MPDPTLEATYRCPGCGTEYTRDVGECGQRKPYECRERVVRMPDPNYPTGALEALIANRASHLHVVGTDGDFCRAHLDALAAMSPENRAALALWLTRGGDFEADEAFEARIQAATVKRVASWLRNAKTCGPPPGPETWAFAIEREFGGGPDAA
jgi:hypothetical protein